MVESLSWNDGMMSNIEEQKFEERLQSIIRHKLFVEDACSLIVKHIYKTEHDERFARQLTANAFSHDNSKFIGVEWLHLDSENKDLRSIAIQHHVSHNEHHPEYWGEIENMPRLYLAEMVADWYARSSEFADGLVVWVKGTAAPKYGFSLKGRVYKDIKYFLDILLNSTFK